MLQMRLTATRRVGRARVEIERSARVCKYKITFGTTKRFGELFKT